MRRLQSPLHWVELPRGTGTRRKAKRKQFGRGGKKVFFSLFLERSADENDYHCHLESDGSRRKVQYYFGIRRFLIFQNILYIEIFR